MNSCSMQVNSWRRKRVPHESKSIILFEDDTNHVNLLHSSWPHLYFVSTSERLSKTKAANNIAFQQQRPATAHFPPGPPVYEVNGGWSHLYAFEIFSSWCFLCTSCQRTQVRHFKRYTPNVILMRFPAVTSFLLIIACLCVICIYLSYIFCLSFFLSVQYHVYIYSLENDLQPRRFVFLLVAHSIRAVLKCLG